MTRRILVIAPHPDDEILGVGGTIARSAHEGCDVFVVILTNGFAPYFDPDSSAIDRQDALEAHALLGVKETRFHDFPAAGLDQIPHRDINACIVDEIHTIQPASVFIPFPDVHMDHQRIHLSSVVACRPHSPAAPRNIYCYETLSETNWNVPYITPAFTPNVFIDISNFLERKLEAMARFRLQQKEFPHERSSKTIRALASLRGSTVHRAAAEAFVLVRQVL